MTATALLLLLPLAGAPADPPAGAAEGTFCSRTLLTWVADLESTDAAAQRAAFEALVKAGPKAKYAVPVLTKLLAKKGANVWYVAGVLGAIGPDAKEAVPALIGALSKDGQYVDESIATALAKIDGPKIEATRALVTGWARCRPNLLVGSQVLADHPQAIVAQVVALCTDKDPHVRARAATFLHDLRSQRFEAQGKSLYELAGDGAKGAVPALEALLADPEVAVRVSAAQSLAHVAPDRAAKAVPVLVAIALDEKPTVHAYAQGAAHIFAPVPAEAAAALIPLFDHASDRVRTWAINTLSALPVRAPIEAALKDGKTARARAGAALALGARAREAAESAPVLKAALTDPEFAVRFAAAKALVWVGPRSGDAVPALVEGLQQADEAVRLEASQTVRAVGPLATAAAPALKTLLGDPVPAVRFEAAVALAAIDPKGAAGAVPVLAAGLGGDLADRVVKALAELGPVAKDAVPALVKKFDPAGHPLVRVSAAEAVARIDPEHGPKATELILDILSDPRHKRGGVRRYCLAALQHIGPAAKSAAPALKAMLVEKGADPAEVAFALVAIDPAAGPALEWIRAALKDDDTHDRQDVLDRLAELGPAAAPFVPEVLAVLKSKAKYQRRQAVLTLAAIGPGAKDALPELKAVAASDPDRNLKAAAAEAVKKIEAK